MKYQGRSDDLDSMILLTNLASVRPTPFFDIVATLQENPHALAVGVRQSKYVCDQRYDHQRGRDPEKGACFVLTLPQGGYAETKVTLLLDVDILT